MKIVLCDINVGMVKAWNGICCDQYYGIDIDIINGSILETNCHMIVSPANSFGFMDGGIDGAYTKFFGRIVQDKIQAHIKNLPMRELLVGKCHIVDTDHDKIKWVASAPTMRVPMDISKTANAYLATKAVLNSIEHDALGLSLKEIDLTIGFPGLGTGAGHMPYDTCARQMHTAFIEKLSGQPKEFPQSLSQIYNEQCDLIRC